MCRVAHVCHYKQWRQQWPPSSLPNTLLMEQVEVLCTSPDSARLDVIYIRVSVLWVTLCVSSDLVFTWILSDLITSGHSEEGTRDLTFQTHCEQKASPATQIMCLSSFLCIHKQQRFVNKVVE